MEWWKRQPEVVRDAAGAVPLLVIFVLTEQVFGDGGPVIRAVAVVLAMGLALSVRRRWPMVTFVTALLTVGIATTGLAFLVVASYTLVTYRPRARPVLIAGLVAAAATVGFWRWWPTYAPEEIAGDLVLVVAISVLPVMLGRAVRDSRHRTVELESRNAELVKLREQAATHAAQTERLRIARELHDVVAHHVSAMTVRARAGHHVASRDPQAAADALAYIAEAGTHTLVAMKGFVGTLRGNGAHAQTPRDLAPQPGLSDIDRLLESFRGTGLVVHAELNCPPATVAPAVGLHAYRIVQEALTNVIRHSAAERAWVSVWATPQALHIQVDDDGRGLRPDTHTAGHGLIGVAERSAMFQGTSALGPSPRGGCRLEAVLSLDQAPHLELVAHADHEAAR